MRLSQAGFLLVLAVGILAALPASAQNQSQSALTQIIQNLANDLVHQNAGNSAAETGHPNPPAVSGSSSSFQQQKARLDRIQSQLNEAQRQLNQEYEQLYGHAGSTGPTTPAPTR